MVPCKAGHVCAGGTAAEDQVPCAAGTYSPRTDLTAQSQCYDCPAGKHCSGGGSAPDGDCTAGYYCPSGSSSATPAATPCPAGTYSSDPGLKSVTECLVCPLGHYCLGGAAVEDPAAVPPTSPNPLVCPLGTFGDIVGLTNYVDDPADAARRGCQACPAGYQCGPTTGLITPVECGVGFWSAAGAQTCQPCPLGYYCDLRATTEAEKDARPCGNGFICGGGTPEQPYHITASYSCPPGSWCAGGVQTACGPGTY
jgi:hypothetical protein